MFLVFAPSALFYLFSPVSVHSAFQMLVIPKTPRKIASAQRYPAHFSRFHVPPTPMPTFNDETSTVQQDVTVGIIHSQDTLQKQNDVKSCFENVNESLSLSAEGEREPKRVSLISSTSEGEDDGFQVHTVPLICEKELSATPSISAESIKEANSLQVATESESDMASDIIILSGSDQSKESSFTSPPRPEIDHYQQSEGEDGNESSVILLHADSEDEYVLRPPPLTSIDSPQPRPSSDTLYRRPSHEPPAPRPYTAEPIEEKYIQKHLHKPTRKRAVMKCTFAKTPHCARPTKAWLSRIRCYQNDN